MFLKLLLSNVPHFFHLFPNFLQLSSDCCGLRLILKDERDLPCRTYPAPVDGQYFVVTFDIQCHLPLKYQFLVQYQFQKMTRETPKVRSGKSLTLLTFDI